VVSLLDRIINTIWRVHGNAMADYQGRVWPDLPAPPDAEPCRSKPPPVDNTDF